MANENTESSCFNDSDNDNFIIYIFKYIICYYKQILLLILAVLTIIAVENLYLYNSLKFGAVNFIPGMSNPPPNIPASTVPKKKRNKK
jgi:hypothetical protein